MSRWTPAGWPLRVRVALAFLGASVVALGGLGVFVHLRMTEALEERLRDTVTVEADRLGGLSGQARLDAVSALSGEIYAQSLTPQGEVLASSRLVAGPLPTSRDGYQDGDAPVYDDDAASGGRRVAESESALLLVRRTDDGTLVVGTSREDTDEALAQLRDQLVIGGALALLLAAALGYVVAGAGLRPIDRMRARAATISGRSAGERLPLPAADDELRRLAVTLNAMLARLDDGVARERAFVAEASHELRTPLTLMLTEIELALDRPRGPEELRAALVSLHEEVRRLVGLAEDVLARGAAVEGRLPLTVGMVDLGALAGDVAARFRVAAGERAITVHAAPTVEVQGDATRLDRALSNLVDNALRHGVGDVTVTVDAGHDGGAVLTVADQGLGGAGDTPTGRSGLGIGIVREIVQAHGGTVELPRDGEPTRVRITLPA